MTTLGDAAAKRTTAVPDLAALILYLLRRAGTARGDTVAVGLSASFPALLPAVLAACRAGGIHPVVILSLGASGYGATREDLTLLDIHTLLLRAGVFEVPPAAVSLGGTRDVGAGFEPGVRDRLRERIAASGFPTFLEDDLEANVRRRLEIYGTGRISAFINAGGSWANLGTSPLALRLRPGLNDPRDLTLPPPGERGVLFALAARGVPVIHLLFIRGLALHHGLPWDPVPLPGPGTSALRDRVSEDGILFWIVSGIWLAAVAGLAAVGLRGPRSPGSDPSRSSPPGDPPAWEPVGVSGEREVRAGAGRPGG